MTYTVLPFAEVKDWDAFCDASSGAWFVHTSGWIEYTLGMRFGAGPVRENLSFGVTDGHRLLAIVPLIKEETDGIAKLAYGGLNTPFPAFSDSLGASEKKAVEKFIFETVRGCSGCDYACFCLSALTNDIFDRSTLVNPLPKHGFHDTTIATHVLNLQKENEEGIYRNFRKGCKSDIKTAQKRGFSVLVVHQENYEARYFDRYRAIHREAAGRQTRSDESWEKQRSWLQAGKSVLALLEKDGVYVSAAFINTYKGRAYYQSAATLLDFEGEVGIGHLIQWEVIRHLKRKGFVWYEIGWNYSPNISQEVADEKLLGISRFKAGFGGDLLPLFRGEYFSSIEYMKTVYAERLAAFESLRERSLRFAAGASSTETASP